MDTDTPAALPLSARAVALAAEVLRAPRAVASNAGENLALLLFADAYGEERLQHFYPRAAPLSADARAEARFALAVREEALAGFLRDGLCDPRLSRLPWAEELELLRRALAETKPV